MLVLAFLWGIEDQRLLTVQEELKRLIGEAVARIGMTPEGLPITRRIPPGVSGWQCLKESHASFHTWPESGALVFEVYSCRPFDASSFVLWLKGRTKAKHLRWEMLGGEGGFLDIFGGKQR